MKLLNTYDTKDEGEKALEKIVGEKRLASERDATVLIYNLFGEPTWTDFYKLGMFDLPELQLILDARKRVDAFDIDRYQTILSTLQYAARSFEIEIPAHWE